MPAPLAYLITWTTYGTWLPGDERGWVREGEYRIQLRDARRQAVSAELLTGDPVVLDSALREVVEATIRAHCEIRCWQLHALNVRSNHVHVVVTAAVSPEEVMTQFKSWCSRRLNAASSAPAGKKWWTRHGSTRWINDEAYLRNATRYVLERQ